MAVRSFALCVCVCVCVCDLLYSWFTRELYKHYVKETIIIPQYNDADEQIDHVSSPTTTIVYNIYPHDVT